MERFAWNGLQKGAASHARPPRCIATTKHFLEPLTPWRALPPWAYRYGRSSIPITRTPFPSRPCGSLHSMVWSHPVGHQSHWGRHPGLPAELDCSIWRTKACHQFESTLIAKLCEFLGCERIRTAAYHPAAIGMAEHLHHQLKAALMSHPDSEHWVDNLPIVLIGIRSSFKPV